MPEHLVTPRVAGGGNEPQQCACRCTQHVFDVVLCVSVCPQLTLSRADVEDVERNAQSCMDHSILAIFEDSTVASEVSDVARL